MRRVIFQIRCPLLLPISYKFSNRLLLRQVEQHFTPHMEKEYLFFSGWKKKDRKGILGISAFEWIYLLCCLMWTLFVSAKQTELLFYAGKAQDNVPRDTKSRAFPTRRITCHTGIFDTIPKILCYLFLEISGSEGKTPHSTDVVHK